MASAHSAPAPGAALATRIAGTVFWGLVVIGLAIAVIESQGLRHRVLAAYAATSDRATLRLEQMASAHPGLAPEAVLPLISREFSIPAIEALRARRLTRIGNIPPGAFVEARHFTYLVQRGTRLAREEVALRMYYPDPAGSVARRRNRLLITLGTLFVAYGFILQWVLQRLLTRPFMRMVYTARDISAGEEALRFDAARDDEFGFLSHFINDSLDYLSQQKNALADALRRVQESEAALFAEKERAEVTLHSIGDAVVTTDAQGRIDYLNPVAETLTRWTQGELRGRPIADALCLIHDGTRAPLENPVTQCLGNGEVVQGDHQGLLVRRDGEEIAIVSSAAPIRDRAGAIIGAIMVFRDVSDHRKLSQQLAYYATHDALTGLCNRREFEARLAQVLACAQDDCEAQHVLCFLDLDQFKVVNDTSGHAAGDELLRTLAALMRHAIRESDLLARLGGDELAILFSHCTLERAAEICERLRRDVQDLRFAWNGRIFQVTTSIGLVPFSGETESVGAAMSAADMACYAAKEAGRNRLNIYDAQDDALQRRHGEMQWVSRIRRAIDERRLRLYYQPIVPLAAQPGDEVHYEILLRLETEDRQLVLPGAFVPAAERYNLMPAVDRWVLGESLAFLRARQGTGPQPCITVNLSGQTLSDPALAGEIIQQIAQSGLSPERICFEITETSAINNMTHANRFVATLRGHGCRFALDDFGNGLSSFAYLKTLKVDFLKIDGGFVQDMVSDRVDYSTVEAIARVGRVMGLKTVAECVENEETLRALRGLGVAFAQGWHVAPAMPLAEWRAHQWPVPAALKPAPPAHDSSRLLET